MIPVYTPWLTPEDRAMGIDAIQSGWVSSRGPYIELFEEEVSKFLRCKHAISVNTGTAACHLAMEALRLPKGSKVIVPGITFVATINAVVQAGYEPVICDIHPWSWVMNYAALRELLTKHDIKAIFYVHLFGVPGGINELMYHIEKEFPDVQFVEDACESFGAYKNRIVNHSEVPDGYIGTFGKMGCFSFFGNKTITTGEGGMVVTNDDELAAYVKLLRGQGQGTQQYYHTVLGYNYRMTNVQAALGLAQLKRMPEIQAEKKRVWLGYKNAGLTTQPDYPTYTAGYWMFTATVENPEKVKAALSAAKIDWRPVFYPLHMLPMYKDCVRSKDMSGTMHLWTKGITLPSYPELTDEQVQFIARTVKDADK